jgi:hypothetical protein
LQIVIGPAHAILIALNFLLSFVLSPTLLLKTRVMTNPIFRENMTLAETSRRATMVGMEVIRKEGALALMKGSVVFSLKRVADWTTRYMFATWFENVLYKRGDPKRKLATNEEMIASLLGGTTSALATLPADVMVAQIQQAKKAGQRVSVVQMFKEQLAAAAFAASPSLPVAALWRASHTSPSPPRS